MEQERLAREKEEQDKAEKTKKIKEQFGDANGQWEKDKSDMQSLVAQEKKKAAAGEDPSPHGAKGEVRAKAAHGA